MTTPRHWLEKIAPPLSAILHAQKQATTESPPEKPLVGRARRRVAEYKIHIHRLFLWPFRFGNVPEPPRITNTDRELARELALLGRRIEETTNEYITPIHFGQLFPGGRPLGECPITIEAEQKFGQYLSGLAQSYTKTRPSRRPAVLRKLSHAMISWWGTVYGAWPGTENQFSIETLSWQEAADLYNVFCFADCTEHTPEQIRKLTAKLIGEVKSTYPICPRCSEPMIFPHFYDRSLSRSKEPS